MTGITVHTDGSLSGVLPCGHDVGDVFHSPSGEPACYVCWTRTREDLESLRMKEDT